ncbi:hypothetical protein LM599_06740 [Candidatus Acetothermia bacterium]|nr:hypothetical protein [Candidatus Acetothermia bacterium]MCI2427517.1 hypothetical protein [Candidatus Acetothermia bacterium]
MMGKMNSQLSFVSIEHLSTWVGLQIIPQDSVYAALGQDREIFRHQLFADAYAGVGHPSKSLTFLCKVLLLRFLCVVS